jgi:hypothetical protein
MNENLYKYQPKQSKYIAKVYLGRTKGKHSEPIYLEGFSWDCGWYWAGGYIGNRNMHAHFDGAFLNSPDPRGHVLGIDPKTMSNQWAIWEDLSFFLDDATFTSNEWWRIKDLYKQFYSLREAAETFQYGGHCTSEGRNPAEINLAMAMQINSHIENVIIPEIMKAIQPKVA